MALAKKSLGVLALAVLAAACSSNGNDTASTTSAATKAESATTVTSPAPGAVVRIENQGGDMEGHTPQGFAGMGIGLFVGDNLNSGFPDGDGLQMFLTFDIPPGLTEGVSAELTSDALNISGTPFEDLGDLRVASVSYTSFGRELFDLEPDSDTVICSRVGDEGLTCDVSEALNADLGEGATQAQFRLRFDTPGDNDASQDLAMFFRTDSNTNEPGLFELVITS